MMVNYSFIMYNRVGGKRSSFLPTRFPTSHTTVRAVPHTAVLRLRYQYVVIH